MFFSFSISTMFSGALLAFLCATVTLSSASPNAELVEKLFGNRYSNNIHEDARLDVPELIKKYGYPAEVHSVMTEDGYILGMHRIPHGRDSNTQGSNKPVIFVMHGLLSSSADFVLMGPGSALDPVSVFIGEDVVERTDLFKYLGSVLHESGDIDYDVKARISAAWAKWPYILAEEGYDVWMGNARGNYYSRNHVRLNPDALLNTDFWKFSWDEIGNIDVPAMIDYVLAHTGQSRLYYIGHSQGTTTFFVMASLRPAYNEKIISMHALAPSAYMEYNEDPLTVFISPFANNIEKVARLFGIGELLPNSDILTWAGFALCMDEVIFQPICSNIFFLVGGRNEDQHNTTMMPVIFGHTPAGAAVRQFVHYAQGIADKGFRRYDHGSWLANMRVYGSRIPPNYDLSKVTAPVFLHYSESDPLAHVNDVDRLFKELGRPIGKFRIPMKKFSHLDFIYGIDAKELVYNRMINQIKYMDING